MENSANDLIQRTIKSGSVYYFEEEEINSKEPHYHIVLNRNPLTEEFIIFVLGSSRVGKRKRIAKSLRFSGKTIVVVSPSEYSIFKKRTVIDCNNVFEKSIQSLVDKHQNGKLKICGQVMPKEIMDKLINGVIASNLVSEKVRKMILGI
jgi:hypothetical protein